MNLFEKLRVDEKHILERLHFDHIRWRMDEKITEACEKSCCSELDDLVGIGALKRGGVRSLAGIVIMLLDKVMSGPCMQQRQQQQADDRYLTEVSSHSFQLVARKRGSPA